LGIEFNDDGMRRLGERVTRMQDVFDRVLAEGKGKPVEEVKGMLARELRAAFGQDAPDDMLSNVATMLAEGRRVEART
jgi:hypothetical protein